MRLSFQPRSHYSYDPTSDVSIPRPRILPTTLASGEGGTEYHYSFFRGEDRIGGLGFDGRDVVVETDGYREWVFTFDLTREQTIQSMLRSKADFGSTDEDLTFLRGLAQGLVLAYAGQMDNEDNLRYIAVTSVEALDQAGVPIAGAIPVHPDKKVVLGEAAVPSHV
ncbi:hypothetical protein [Stenotrophomonas sp. GbtcB23]|uniref:hypothetical protein n=1 Tax=Stenotrophomonas sp. GbtcB23 TaxID=2824768 RepID=UPI001C2F52B3|nr:hypothetical protein [Stenotrophomonas sp. GbtcB23]